VTHAIRFAESFADRMVLDAGRVVENLPAQQFRTSNHPAVRKYLAHC
jgi:ABC-type polar amino acid transport system ATPase subunit